MRHSVTHISLLYFAQSAICALALCQMDFPVRAQSVPVRSPQKPRNQHPVKQVNSGKAKAKARVPSTGETTVINAEPLADQTQTKSSTSSMSSGGSPEPKSANFTRAKPFDGDLRELPQTKPEKMERPKRKEPTPAPVQIIKDDPDQLSD